VLFGVHSPNKENENVPELPVTAGGEIFFSIPVLTLTLTLHLDPNINPNPSPPETVETHSPAASSKIALSAVDLAPEYLYCFVA